MKRISLLIVCWFFSLSLFAQTNIEKEKLNAVPQIKMEGKKVSIVNAKEVSRKDPVNPVAKPKEEEQKFKDELNYREERIGHQLRESTHKSTKR